MCGIAGIIDLDGQEKVDEALIARMCSVMEHRGPSDRGTDVGPGYGLGSVRLAILDLSPLGHMPMKDDSGRYSIVYNGEVYNFADLRKGLEAEGDRFRSHCDTEVILKSVIRHGLDQLNQFNGMFAFAFHDKLAKRTILVRDRLGVKPLFYSFQGRKLVFASEIKALWAAGVPKQFNPERFGEQFSLRYVAGTETVYQNIKRLLPGACMVIENGQYTIKRWWRLGDHARRSAVATGAAVPEWYRTMFDSSVALRKISDVPVGVLLSGGLDSGSVAASMALSSNQPISSFTVRFNEGGFDEGVLAGMIADKYRLERNELIIQPDKLSELNRQMYAFHDEPMVHASDLYILQIAKLAKKKVTVLLSGEGGDETLGGYTRYRLFAQSGLLQLGFRLKALPAAWPIKSRKMRKLDHILSLNSIDQYIHFNSTEIFPKDAGKLGLKGPICSEYRQNLLEEAKEVFPSDPMRQAMFYDMHTYLCSVLDRNDIMTMAASMECRVPFLDYRIIEGLMTLPTPEILRGGKPKGLLREALGSRLPNEVLTGRKWGFGIPWHLYYANLPEYREQLQQLHKHPLVEQCFSNIGAVKAVADDFLNGNQEQFGIVHQLMSSKLWYDSHFG